MKLLALISFSLALAACSGSSNTPTCIGPDGGCTLTDAGNGAPPAPSTDGGCAAQFSGVYGELDQYPSCCVVTVDASLGDTLNCYFDASTEQINNQFNVFIGMQPASGEIDSSSQTNWSTDSYSYATDSVDCQFEATPTAGGDFSLQISSVEDPGDGGPPIVHGTLKIDEITGTPDQGADGCGAQGEEILASF